MNIRFRGGPLDGQVRDVALHARPHGNELPSYFSVAVRPPLELRTVDRVINPGELMFSKVDYQLVRVGRGHWDFEYRVRN